MSGEYINGCELPSNFYKLDFKTQFNITDYLDQLDPIEVRAYGIAKQHLKTSFNVVKSNGYIDWLKNKEQQMQFEEHKGTS